MTPENESKLFEAAPLLYSELRLRPTPHLWLGLGRIECGDGWLGSLLDSSAALEALIRAEVDPDRYRARQVKEKFGTLRFYMSDTTDAMKSLIHAAEQASATICEDCGATGSTGSFGGLARTVCSDHAAEWKARRGGRRRRVRPSEPKPIEPNTNSVRMSPEWVDEIKRRIDDIESGRVQLISEKEMNASIERRLGRSIRRK